ncbi:2'(,)3'-cyclic-nucleotide 2'-phosphodiesterase/5'- or 3'-nucleotidase(,) 5'-nucleotidase family [Parelusimicrobium proximum]|uniref:bifunctional metallophosphatase/5'-nucleotidase n=1 Tax=Parelusimicrobium proximum TaxID=3228953 RepID=UPI003D17A53D
MKKLLLSFLLFSFALLTQAKDVVIYHTSDTHGYYFAQVNEKGELQGGFAALASYIKADSEGNENYLLLDSGDFMQGNLEANASKGLDSAKVLNAAGYTAVTIGNHEFDFKTSLSDVAERLNADILAANFEGIPRAIPYKIYEVDGVKIAVIGIGLNGEKNKTYKALDTVESYKKAVKEAYSHNPDAVVLLIHSSNYDYRTNISPKDLINTSDYNIDVALGGHMHARKIKNADGVLYVDSGTRTQYVSKVVMSFDDESGRFKGAKGRSVPLLISKTGEDNGVKAVTESIRNPLNEKVIAHINRRFLFESNKKNKLDNELSNFVADLFVRETGADFAFNNTKMFRGSLPKGDVTVRDITQAIPYDNTLSVIKVKGSFIYEIIRVGTKPDFSLFQYSGLRVKAVFVNDELKKLDIKINGKALDPDKEYTMATNDFIAFSNTYEAEPFKAIAEDKKHNLGISIKELVLNELKNNASVKPAKLGRIKVKNKTKK